MTDEHHGAARGRRRHQARRPGRDARADRRLPRPDRDRLAHQPPDAGAIRAPRAVRAPSRCSGWAARPCAATSCARSSPTACVCRSSRSATTSCRRGSGRHAGHRRLAQRRDRGDDQRPGRRPRAALRGGGHHHRWADRRCRGARQPAAPDLPQRGAAARVAGLHDDAPDRTAREGRPAGARRRRGCRGGRAARAVGVACAPDVPTASNLAKQLAWSLLDRLPVIEGSGFHGRRRAALEDAAQREQPLGGDRRGAARGDAQRGRRLRAARDFARPPIRRLPGSERATSRATASGPACRASCSTRSTSITRRVTFDGRGQFAQACRVRSAWATTSASTWPCSTARTRSATESLTMIKASMAEFDPLAEGRSAAIPLTRFGD